MNYSVINTPQMSSVGQQSSSYSQNNPRDNRCFNIKESNSKRNELPSPVIPVPPLFNDSVIKPPQLSSVGQQSSRSSKNTTHELQYSSIPGWTSPHLSNTIPPLSTNNRSRNIYLSCPRFVNSHPALHRTLLVITSALIESTVTQREMSCHHR